MRRKNIPPALSSLLIVLSLLAFAVLPCAAQVYRPPNRVALLIGNSKYPASPTAAPSSQILLTALESPPKDVAVVEKALAQIGFISEVHRDLNTDQMRQVVAAFAEKYSEAEVVFFYYSGHVLRFGKGNHLAGCSANLDVVKEFELKNAAFRKGAITEAELTADPKPAMFARETVDVEKEVFAALSRMGSGDEQLKIFIVDAAPAPFAAVTAKVQAALNSFYQPELAEMTAQRDMVIGLMSPTKNAKAVTLSREGTSPLVEVLSQKMSNTGISLRKFIAEATSQIRGAELKFTISTGDKLPPFEFRPGTPKIHHKNSLGMEFVQIMVGADSRGKGKPLWICNTETSMGQFEAFSNELKRGWRKPLGKGLDYPVTEVSYEDALLFCEWLTKREHAMGTMPGDPEKARYRLPTDYEWSCAVGIGSLENRDLSPKEKHNQHPTIYPWGAWPPPRDVANYGFTGKDTTLIKLSSMMDPSGLYHLGGNVWEMCEDWYDPREQTYRVLRGGSFMDKDPERLRSSFRSQIVPTASDTYVDVGFRIVLDRGN